MSLLLDDMQESLRKRDRCHAHCNRQDGIKSEHHGGDGSSPPKKNPQVLINGSAGTGKTTISHTVAGECKKCGILGASFFSSRGDPTCSDTGLVFTTIACQIGTFGPPFKAEVSRAMISQPDIGYAGISYQTEQLLVNPRRGRGGCARRMQGQRNPIDNLVRYVPQLAPLKILVTSRPENHITTAFRNRDLAPSTRRLRFTWT